MSHLRITIAFAFSALLLGGSASAGDLEDNLSLISLPAGFEISIYAQDLPNARSMTLSPSGILYVGTRTQGKVYAVVDKDKDYKADKTYVVLDDTTLSDGSDLVMPNGVAFKDGDLYVGALGHILRIDGIEKNLKKPAAPVIVSHHHPDAKHHGWKFIAFGPDEKLYVPVGAPCNICDKDEDIFASITRMNADGSDLEIIAHGVRNTVGFDWHPVTKELWFTENGRDMMGDNTPADELNRLSVVGQHFGFPYVHQGDTLDPMFGQDASTGDFEAPAIALGPHVAALGMRFYSGKMFPSEYKNQIFIAEHGSWNRKTRIGYRITLVRLDGNKALSYEVFADGWLNGKKVWGRPADLLFLPDGSMLVSDEKSGAIFRITYTG